MDTSAKKDIMIESSWKQALAPCFETEAFHNLTAFIRSEYATKQVYPNPKHIFNAFTLTPFDEVKVVILGQDPYHDDGQAHGLSFSVPDTIPIPPSLRNIYKEIEADCGVSKAGVTGNLESWAKQGVLLLNAILTVVAHTPASHRGKGWELFTDTVIKTVSDTHEHVVFMLWGNYARSKKSLIDTSKHLVLEAPHPSPLSAHTGFFGCRHFSLCNEYLKKQGKKPVIW
jgi:uracil-DNA glycosylase